MQSISYGAAGSRIQTGEAIHSRQPQIEEALDELSVAIQRSEELQIEMEAKLRCVMLPRSEGEASGTSVPEPVRAPLAGTIHDFTERIAQINARNMQVIRELELPDPDCKGAA